MNEILRIKSNQYLASGGGNTISEIFQPVSYTHLDVYKRQNLWWRAATLPYVRSPSI